MIKFERLHVRWIVSFFAGIGTLLLSKFGQILALNNGGYQLTQLDKGDAAPQFTLPTDGGGEFTLSSNNSSKIVIFFYPKDDTSGCTAEAIDFTAAKDKFADLDVKIIGMSPDPVKKHDKFKTKHELDAILVSDEDKKVLDAYGVWVEKSMYGRKYMGVERSTFLIAKDGEIIRSWRKVKVPGHVDEVLAAAAE